MYDINSCTVYEKKILLLRLVGHAKGFLVHILSGTQLALNGNLVTIVLNVDM